MRRSGEGATEGTGPGSVAQGDEESLEGALTDRARRGEPGELLGTRPARAQRARREHHPEPGGSGHHPDVKDRMAADVPAHESAEHPPRAQGTPSCQSPDSMSLA